MCEDVPAERSEEGTGKLEDEADDEDDMHEEGRRASRDVPGTCTRMAQSIMKPEYNAMRKSAESEDGQNAEDGGVAEKDRTSRRAGSRLSEAPR